MSSIKELPYSLNSLKEMLASINRGRWYIKSAETDFWRQTNQNFMQDTHPDANFPFFLFVFVERVLDKT